MVDFQGSWICCLNGAERQALREMALAFVVGVAPPVPELLWQSFWGLTFKSRAARQAAFIELYHLEAVNIAGDNFISYTDLVFWAEMSLFFLSPSGACTGGCQLVTYQRT